MTRRTKCCGEWAPMRHGLMASVITILLLAMTTNASQRGLLGDGSTQQRLKDKISASRAGGSIVVVAVSGQSTGRTSSTSVGIAKIENGVQEIVEDAFSEIEGGADVEASLEVAAEAVGLAVAQAFAEAEAEVSVTGQGFAAAQAESRAAVLATATATAIVDAVAFATNGNDDAIARVKVASLASEMAQALADALVQVQTEGGTAFSRQTSFAEAVARPVARALGAVFALVFEGESISESFGEGTSEIDLGSVSVESSSESDTEGISKAAATGETDALTDRPGGTTIPMDVGSETPESPPAPQQTSEADQTKETQQPQEPPQEMQVQPPPPSPPSPPPPSPPSPPPPSPPSPPPPSPPSPPPPSPPSPPPPSPPSPPPPSPPSPPPPSPPSPPPQPPAFVASTEDECANDPACVSNYRRTKENLPFTKMVVEEPTPEEQQITPEEQQSGTEGEGGDGGKDGQDDQKDAGESVPMTMEDCLGDPVCIAKVKREQKRAPPAPPAPVETAQEQGSVDDSSAQQGESPAEQQQQQQPPPPVVREEDCNGDQVCIARAKRERMRSPPAPPAPVETVAEQGGVEEATAQPDDSTDQQEPDQRPEVLREEDCNGDQVCIARFKRDQRNRPDTGSVPAPPTPVGEVEQGEGGSKPDQDRVDEQESVPAPPEKKEVVREEDCNGDPVCVARAKRASRNQPSPPPPPPSPPAPPSPPKPTPPPRQRGSARDRLASLVSRRGVPSRSRSPMMSSTMTTTQTSTPTESVPTPSSDGGNKADEEETPAPKKRTKCRSIASFCCRNSVRKEGCTCRRSKNSCLFERVAEVDGKTTAWLDTRTGRECDC